MSTLRKYVSDIRVLYRILSTDNLITDRAIASEIKSTALLLIKRETNLRKLWATDTVFTTIPCLEMIEVPIIDCGDYAGDEEMTIARSVVKLPKIAEGNYNYVIQGVYSINVLGGSGKRLKETSINRFLNIQKLPAKKNEEYFWINDDYLYVSSSFVKKVRISALFMETIPNDILFPESVCSTKNFDLKDYCMNPLDREFFLPGYLEKQVKDLVGESLRKSYFSIQQDVSNEGVDGQQINSTVTD